MSDIAAPIVIIQNVKPTPVVRPELILNVSSADSSFGLDVLIRYFAIACWTIPVAIASGNVSGALNCDLEAAWIQRPQ